MVQLEVMPTEQMNGNKYNNGSGSSYGSTVATGDVIGIAYDGDNGALYFSKNGIWQNSGDPTSGASATGAAFTGLGNQTWTIACGNAGGSTNGTATNFNFGQRAFAYTPPTGYKALNTANLPAPDIADGSQYFDTVLLGPETLLVPAEPLVVWRLVQILFGQKVEIKLFRTN
jgi:hypothetical protein